MIYNNDKKVNGIITCYFRLISQELISSLYLLCLVTRIKIKVTFVISACQLNGSDNDITRVIRIITVTTIITIIIMMSIIVR